MQGCAQGGSPVGVGVAITKAEEMVEEQPGMVPVEIATPSEEVLVVHEAF